MSTPTQVYGSRTTRRRRTPEEMDALRAAIYDVACENQPATVRQIYYRLVVAGAIEKTEADYRAVQRQMVLMRRSGDLHWQWITDGTRYQIKPNSYSSLEAALKSTARNYRRDLWADQGVQIEVWCESDALAGVIQGATWKWDVPLMVIRGFSSVTFLHSAARDIATIDKPAHLYYFGDWDPSGVCIEEKVEEELRKYAPDADIHFARVAVTPKQIQDFGLPTRPPKKTDTRSRSFDGGTVEIEALAPDHLRGLVESCIDRHVDPAALAIVQAAEKSEREMLYLFAEEAEDPA